MQKRHKEKMSMNTSKYIWLYNVIQNLKRIADFKFPVYTKAVN